MTAQELIAKPDFNFGCVFGPAGSGKSYLIRKVLDLNPSWGLIAATTGAAARVLGPEIRTIHSTLGIFDLTSIKHSYAKGDLYDILEDLHKRYERIVVDEVSMLGREMFEIIAAASEEIGIGLILVGDFLQLPPVPDKKKPVTWSDKSDWLFRSQAFTKFAKNAITLQTQYRFNDADYIRGINFLRAGKGLEAIPHLEKAGVTFMPLGTLGKGFQGTAIVATKNQRDHINNVRFAALKRKPNIYKATRFGTQRPEWTEIPNSISLKVGARVMVLRNLYEFGNLVQSNGDMGIVRELLGDAVLVERDDKKIIEVKMFEADDGVSHQGHDGSGRFTVVDQWPTGSIRYMPLTLAWSMNVHKCQGLTLTHPARVLMENFFKAPAMVYVACSRVADPRHLTIIGGGTTTRMVMSGEIVESHDVPQLGMYCNMDPAVIEFL